MDTDEILGCQDINTLLKEKVILTKNIGELHTNVKLYHGEVEETEYKSKLTTAYAVLEVLQHQQDVLREKERINSEEESRVKYNFMVIAKNILKKETYNKIYGMAQNPLKEVRPLLGELSKQKLE